MSAASVTAAKPAKRSRRRRAWPEVLRVVVLVLIGIPWIAVPLWMLLINSVKPDSEAGQLGLGLPRQWRFDNYAIVFSQGNYLSGLANSLLVALPTLLCVLLFGSLAAWAFARSTRRGMRAAYVLSVLSILLPPAILPTIFELQELGIDGTRWGYFLVMTGTRMGTVVFLATGFVRTMPPDLEEAAALDGASRLQIYRLVMLPALLPILLVGGVILIISVWNEFLFSLFLLRPSSATLPLGLYQFASASSDFAAIRWELVFANVVLTSLPILIVYVLVQGRLVDGLTEGAIKG